MQKAIGILIFILLIGTGYWAWSTLQDVQNTNQEALIIGEQNPESNQQSIKSEFALTKRSDANSVTVDVLLLNPLGQVADKELVFRLTLNTHSVPLSKYDIAKSAIVKSSDGKVSTGFSWQAESEAEHHRSGLLKVTNNGILGPKTKWITLELKTLADVPVREFRWEEADLL
ncbi:MAG: hypothetical protein WA118_05180 [Carboxydocellales bacterium]